MLTLAAIGAGYWGKNLIRNFAALDEVDLRYVCVRREASCLAAAAKYPQATATTDLAAVLGDPLVQAVVVAVRSPEHYQIAAAALAAGKHTFVEKPLTLDAADAQRLVDAAAAAGVKLMVGHLMVYHPAVAAMKRLIDAGTFGRPLYLYSRRVNLGIVRHVESAWWSLAPHDVSIACHLFDADPVRISATGAAYLQRGIEDVVYAQLTFADGRTAHIHVSWLDPNKVRRTTLVGTRKMAIFDDMAPEKLRLYDKSIAVEGAPAEPRAVVLGGGEVETVDIGGAEPLQLECRHFVDCIVNDTAPLSDGGDGLRVVRALQAGQTSLRRGGAPVDIET